MKQLAAKADERWKSVPSYLDGPKNQQAQPAMALKDPGGYAPQTEPEHKQGVMSGVEDAEAVAQVSEGVDGKAVSEGRFKGKTAKANPWHKQTGGPGEDWQPQSWTPGPVQR